MSKLTNPDSDLWERRGGAHWRWHKLQSGGEIGTYIGDDPRAPRMVFRREHAEHSLKFEVIDILDALALLTEDEKHEAR